VQSFEAAFDFTWTGHSPNGYRVRKPVERKRSNRLILEEPAEQTFGAGRNHHAAEWRDRAQRRCQHRRLPDYDVLGRLAGGVAADNHQTGSDADASK
jgi:hypothetical protein